MGEGGLGFPANHGKERHCPRFFPVATPYFLPKRFHLSPRGFYRHFKEQVGRTPRQELIRLRVEAARDLLATTDLYVGEVSDRCGFPDAEAMTRAFRALLGKTPSGYRESLRVG